MQNDGAGSKITANRKAHDRLREARDMAEVSAAFKDYSSTSAEVRNTINDPEAAGNLVQRYDQAVVAKLGK
jgi:hypothetical protein